MTIGERIRDLRKQKGMTQDELAKAVGYKSRVSINKIELERDGRSVKLSKVKNFATALDTSVDYLMGWTDNPEKNDFDARAENYIKYKNKYMKEVEQILSKDLIAKLASLDEEDLNYIIGLIERMSRKG